MGVKKRGGRTGRGGRGGRGPQGGKAAEGRGGGRHGLSDSPMSPEVLGAGQVLLQEREQFLVRDGENQKLIEGLKKLIEGLKNRLEEQQRVWNERLVTREKNEQDVLAAIVQAEQRCATLQKQLVKTKEKLKRHDILLENLSDKEFKITAAEMWKRSVNSHQLDPTALGNGLQLYNREVYFNVKALANSVGETVSTIREISRRCIVARNASSHFESYEELEKAICNCLKLIDIFPHFETKYQLQCRSMKWHKIFKSALPDAFKD